MNDNWTDAERLAAEVLASGSDEALRELLAELDRGAPTSRRSDPEDSSSTSRLRRWFPGRRRRPGGTRARRSLGRFSWRDSDLLNVVADLFLVLVALASIAIGMRPYAAPVADAGPALTEVLEGSPSPRLRTVGSRRGVRRSPPPSGRCRPPSRSPCRREAWRQRSVAITR